MVLHARACSRRLRCPRRQCLASGGGPRGAGVRAAPPMRCGCRCSLRQGGSDRVVLHKVPHWRPPARAWASHQRSVGSTAVQLGASASTGALERARRFGISDRRGEATGGAGSSPHLLAPLRGAVVHRGQAACAACSARQHPGSRRCRCRHPRCRSWRRRCRRWGECSRRGREWSGGWGCGLGCGPVRRASRPRGHHSRARRLRSCHGLRHRRGGSHAGAMVASRRAAIVLCVASQRGARRGVRGGGAASLQPSCCRGPRGGRATAGRGGRRERARVPGLFRGGSCQGERAAGATG
mmetsp:Transcript_3420/g.10788  ORF Transcript_3420/g.10788 Transcript_3420/m.10788 type:complete len:296 (+) Transcript_3420:1134-2021(+)